MDLKAPGCSTVDCVPLRHITPDGVAAYTPSGPTATASEEATPSDEIADTAICMEELTLTVWMPAMVNTYRWRRPKAIPEVERRDSVMAVTAESMAAVPAGMSGEAVAATTTDDLWHTGLRSVTALMGDTVDSNDETGIGRREGST